VKERNYWPGGQFRNKEEPVPRTHCGVDAIGGINNQMCDQGFPTINLIDSITYATRRSGTRRRVLENISKTTVFSKAVTPGICENFAETQIHSSCLSAIFTSSLTYRATQACIFMPLVVNLVPRSHELWLK
jgi:hypothetical protein